MIRRAEVAREGGLQMMQREAVPLLIAAFDAEAPAAAYVVSNLHWHLKQAQQPMAPIQYDEVLIRVLTHEIGSIRKQATVAIGRAQLSAAADACDLVGDHQRAAELMYAACAGRGVAAGADSQRAWASLKLLEEAGRGSPASRKLERLLLATLSFSSEGGFAFGSTEHVAMMRRIEALSGEVAGSGGDSGLSSTEIYERELGLSLGPVLNGFGHEHISGYAGPVTREVVAQAQEELRQAAMHSFQAAAAAPNALLWGIANTFAVFVRCFPRQHPLPEFSWETSFGVDGAYLREAIEG